MKLVDYKIDYVMDDLSMEKDSGFNITDTARTSGINVSNTYLQLTPSAGSAQPAAGPKPRRATVSVACERCRKRKTKCSGLPGPCTNCARLGVACHEPGRHRSTVQSTLEDRIHRLRTLQAANRSSAQGGPTPLPEGQDVFSYVPTESGQTPNAQMAYGSISSSALHEFGAPSPASAHSSEGWAAAVNPASYFDNQLQEAMDWNISELPSEDTSVASHRSRHHLESTSSRHFSPSHLFNFPTDKDSNVPAEETASTNISIPDIPVLQRQSTPIGFTISYASSFFDESELKEAKPNPLSPLSFEQEKNPTDNAFTPDNWRSRRQSSSIPQPSSRPSPTLSVRALHQPLNALAEQGYQLTRSQTVPTSNAAASEQELQETGLLSLIIRSDDTQRYMAKYFATAHTSYPFLDPAIFGERKNMLDQLPSYNYNIIQQQTMIHFEALLIAAIGALVQYESTTMASQYVKQALAIKDQFDMWSSVGGIHCAMLLALYCYLAQIMVYDTRQDESAEAQRGMGFGSRSSRYPVNNLWMHNCQIAAACIDLGMHQPLAMQEQIRSQSDIRGYLESCRNTIRSAYVLDRRISELRNRPRAFHDADIDRTLLVDL